MKSRSKEWLSRRSRHWLAKIVCLLIAVIFWLYVMRVEPPEYTETYVDIPVTVLGDNGFSYTGTASNLASVRVKATRSVLAQHGKQDVTAWVSLLDLQDQEELLKDGQTVKLVVHFDIPSVLRVENEGTYEVDVTLQEKAP